MTQSPENPLTTEEVDVAADQLPRLELPGQEPAPTATQLQGEYERGDSAREEMDPR